ncbi:MAG: hypothetical protein M0Z59_07665 [Nitrospiraceae bacterium]|nr:hypothetical protein [Nitrospiraceae bacterium]
MKIVHVLKTEPDDLAKGVIEAHKKANDVRVFELYRGLFNAEELLEEMERADRVFCW